MTKALIKGRDKGIHGILECKLNEVKQENTHLKADVKSVSSKTTR